MSWPAYHDERLNRIEWQDGDDDGELAARTPGEYFGKYLCETAGLQQWNP